MVEIEVLERLHHMGSLASWLQPHAFASGAPSTASSVAAFPLHVAFLCGSQTFRPDLVCLATPLHRREGKRECIAAIRLKSSTLEAWSAHRLDHFFPIIHLPSFSRVGCHACR